MNNRDGRPIAVIDDDPSLRRSVRNLLSSVGYPVETFVSAEELLGSPRLPDLGGLILDQKLEGMSGLDLLARLPALAGGLPVIMLTAYGDDEGKGQGDIRRRALALGAVAFLSKPFQPDNLLRAVEQAMAHTHPSKP